MLKNKLFVILVIVFILLLGVFGSFAYFIINIEKDIKMQPSVNTGLLSLIFEDDNNEINEKLNFGDFVVKEFTIENNGSLDAIAKISFDNIINTYTYKSLTYTLSYSPTSDGVYSDIITNKNVPYSEISSKFILANGLEIPAGEKYYYKLTITLNYLDDIDQTEDLNAIFTSKFVLSDGNKQVPVSEQIKDQYENNTYCPPNFATISNINEKVCTMKDDYGDSYYYRGVIENNYVKFAGLTFRIIRLNGDGSLRIIYYGAAGNLPWNYTNYTDPKYLGYMYGGANGVFSTSYKQAVTNETSSNAKAVVENWYKLNIEEKGYGNYVSDRIFCNDRSIVSGNGFGRNSNTTYGAYRRIVVNHAPSFICPQDNDKFTVSSKNGNGTLTYPVGLITADEAIAAGLMYHTSGGGHVPSHYLSFIGYSYTMTPCWVQSGFNSMFNSDTGKIIRLGTNNYSRLIPVINLSIDAVDSLIGTGTINDPYRLE